MKEVLSFQCLLPQGDTRIVAWIEEPGLWEVIEVYQPPRTAAWLQENAGRVRKGLPSG
jgi:hypothetical protein